MAGRLEIKDEYFWNIIWKILIDECSAYPSEQPHFSFIMSHYDVVGFRFQGSLGFGGKLWNNNNKIYVNCYPEDETKERVYTIDKTNERIENFLKWYLDSFGQ